MKFRLPRQIVIQDINKIILKEVRRQLISLPPIPKDKIKEISRISKAIEKHGLPTNLVCKKLPMNFGHGIFLHPNAKPILKGDIIAPYSGEVFIVPESQPDDSVYSFSLLSGIVLTKEEQAILNPKGRYHPKRRYCLNLDAMKNGNFTRFINHSTEPNVTADMLRMPRNKQGLSASLIEIIFVAEKTILPGEQLLVNYEGAEDNSYWGPLEIVPIHKTPQTFKLDRSLKLINNHKDQLSNKLAKQPKGKKF